MDNHEANKSLIEKHSFATKAAIDINQAMTSTHEPNTEVSETEHHEQGKVINGDGIRGITINLPDEAICDIRK